MIDVHVKFYGNKIERRGEWRSPWINLGPYIELNHPLQIFYMISQFSFRNDQCIYNWQVSVLDLRTTRMAVRYLYRSDTHGNQLHAVLSGFLIGFLSDSICDWDASTTAARKVISCRHASLLIFYLFLH